MTASHHRFDRGGNRERNAALHRIAIVQAFVPTHPRLRRAQNLPAIDGGFYALLTTCHASRSVFSGGSAMTDWQRPGKLTSLGSRLSDSCDLPGGKVGWFVDLAGERICLGARHRAFELRWQSHTRIAARVASRSQYCCPGR
jgi:hypothetical protein